MSIEQHDSVDYIGVERSSGKLVLTVSDHLDWVDSATHQFAIQEKLNTYFRFVESGEIYGTYPDAKNRSVVFEIVMRIAPPNDEAAFLDRVRDAVERAGIEFRWRVQESLASRTSANIGGRIPGDA